MITNLFLQAVTQFVKGRIEKMSQEMTETLDLATFEQELDEMMCEVCTMMSAIKLTELLTSAEFLAKLKQFRGTQGNAFQRIPNRHGLLRHRQNGADTDAVFCQSKTGKEDGRNEDQMDEAAI